MNCTNHTNKPADGACVYCGKFFCKDCLVEVKGKMYCKGCLSNVFDELRESSSKQQVPMVFMNAGGGGASSSSSSSSSAAAAGGIPQTSDISTRSKITALFLCLFLVVGLGGFHRFYTGHTFSGLLQLLTFGGFLIWQILDFLSILAGTFRDSEGKLLR